MIKLILECKHCGYIWYPEKERWEKYPDANEPDCPNETCRFHGIGDHKPKPSIWNVRGEIQVPE